MSSPSMEAARPLARGNQRATVRYRCAPATVGKVVLPEEDQEFQRGWVLNVSRAGVGVVLVRPLPVGTYIVLQVRGAGGRVDLPAHVRHSTLQIQSDWLIGCELLKPLGEDELEALL